MKNILLEIFENKLLENAEAQKKISLPEMKHLAANSNHTANSFIKAIEAKTRANQPALIAEIKKKSPSKGIIRQNFEPVEIARAYEAAGATCLSILTDEKFFAGKNEYLQEVKKISKLPILRKDFIINEYQIYQTKALGADCLLLIMSILKPSEAITLEKTAHDLGLDVLIEVHTEKELEQALKLKSKLIGINNRNLDTFEVSLDIGKNLAKLIPGGYIKICESGIYKNSEILYMMDHGFSGFLVGESLMREADIEAATKKLLGT